MLLRYIRLTFTFLIIGLILSACHHDDPIEPVKEPADTSILLYAVASNNLSSSFYEDLKEMEIGLANVDLSEIDYYIYAVTQGIDPGPYLWKAEKDNNGKVVFEEIKQYDRSLSSAHPQRISDVISDFNTLTQGTTKGLILWSHSTAWASSPDFQPYLEVAPSSNRIASSPDFSGSVSGIQQIELPQIRWWGQDIEAGNAYYCEMPDLASAIPDNYFDFIWFDCCYMSSIEVIYEMRNKAPIFVAYPTEVLAEGAPYDIVLPFIATKNPNLVAAADAMSDYYLRGNKTFTMAVIDPSPIEEIADYCVKAIPGKRVYAHKLMKYSRGGYDFYDFGQYISEWGGSLGDDWDLKGFKDALDRMVIYKNCGDKLFSGKLIDKENFSGVSSGYFNYDGSSDYDVDPDDIYYMKLAWFDRVYKSSWPFK